MNEDKTAQLKLVAMDQEDLDVISAVCQDAVLRVADLNYLANEDRFVIAINRFVWEQEPGKARKKSFERRRSALHFEGVKKVQVMGIDRTDKETILSLLAVRFEKSDEPAGEVELIFAGDGAIKLSVECIEAQLADLGAAWATKSQPKHAD